jgi:DHA1 family bicyclomycin/chloramphenicol resistance-like MFS transporter
MARDLAREGDATALLSVLLSILGATPLLAPLLGAVLLGFAGWRAPLSFIAIYGAVLFASVALVLPETRLHPPMRGDAIASMGRALRSPQFRRGAMLASLSHAGYLALVTSSSTLLASHYGLGPAAFAWLFAIASGAFCLGPIVTGRLSRSMYDRLLLTAGIACVAAASVGLVVLAGMPAPPLAALWTCVVIYLFGHGMTAPMFSAQALAPLAGAAGVAAALMGALQISFGFIGSLAVSQLTVLGAAGLALVMAGAGLTAASIYWLGDGGRS